MSPEGIDPQEAVYGDKYKPRKHKAVSQTPQTADEAKAAITARMKQEIAQTFLAGMPELTPRQQEYITKRLEEL